MGVLIKGKIQAAAILSDPKLQAKFIEAVDSYMKLKISPMQQE